MVKGKKRLLTGAIVAALVASGIAYGEEANKPSLYGDFFNDSFFTNSQVKLSLNNFFRIKRYQESDPTNPGQIVDPEIAKTPSDSVTIRNRGWAQTAVLDYQSGWFMNWVGLDFTAYHTVKLYGKEDKANVGLFSLDRNNNPHGYGKQAYDVRLNLMDYGTLKYGRMTYDTPFIKSNAHLTQPLIYEGFYGDASWEGLNLHAGYIMKESNYGQTGFSSLYVPQQITYTKDSDNNITGVTFTDHKKRPLIIGGADYKYEDLSVQFAFMSQQDYRRYFYADAEYSVDLQDNMGNLGLCGQYGHVDMIGKTKKAVETVNDTYDTSFKKNLGWWGAKANWKLSHFDAAFSYTAVNRDTGKYLSFETASHSYWLKNEGATSGSSFLGYTKGIVNDFSRPGTRTSRVDLAYDFEGMLPGLDTKAGFTIGTVDQGNGKKDRNVSEIDFELNYHIPQVKGLSAAFQIGHYRETWRSGGDNNDRDKYRLREQDTRIMLNYETMMF